MRGLRVLSEVTQVLRWGIVCLPDAVLNVHDLLHRFSEVFDSVLSKPEVVLLEDGTVLLLLLR